MTFRGNTDTPFLYTLFIIIHFFHLDFKYLKQYNITRYIFIKNEIFRNINVYIIYIV